MSRTVATGIQDFEKLRTGRYFYVDKTGFIEAWWKNADDVTMITRPRRFGKTLTMDMMNCFFSIRYANRTELFEGLRVSKDAEMQRQQGTWPVINLSFAGVKGTTCEGTIKLIKKILVRQFSDYPELQTSEKLGRYERKALEQIDESMDDEDAAMSLNLLSTLLEKHYGKKVLIFLDEYDTPLQEAWLNGFWDELLSFIRILFNNTFKTNSSLHRGVMTGITRIGEEFIFSELDNAVMMTTTSIPYATDFGFTEDEVFHALDEQGLGDKKAEVKEWYDGFAFGGVKDIYNPWAVTNFLKHGVLAPYWTNSSGNGLADQLLRHGNKRVKSQFEALLSGETIETTLNEEVVFSQLGNDSNAIWSFLLATGYLKVVSGPRREESRPFGNPVYTLALTNMEVRNMFYGMVHQWFDQGSYSMSDFVDSMLSGNVEEMNLFMNQIALTSFSSFDTASSQGQTEPERFYHGFVLGLLVEKQNEYLLKSNRESGFGRYAVILQPRDVKKPAVIMEFKVFNKEEGEKKLHDTAVRALRQIEEKQYVTELLDHGIAEANILKYGMAFRGKECLILRG